jgi:hypothetical protein
MPTQSPSDPQLRDVELMQSCARRDPAAQREVASRLVARVRRLSRLLLKEPVEAEDAAQLALLEILQSASGFRRAGCLEAWADRITARTTLRLARELRARRSVFQRMTDWETLLETFPGLSVKPYAGSNLSAFLERRRSPPAARPRRDSRESVAVTGGPTCRSADRGSGPPAHRPPSSRTPTANLQPPESLSLSLRSPSEKRPRRVACKCRTSRRLHVCRHRFRACLQLLQAGRRNCRCRTVGVGVRAGFPAPALLAQRLHPVPAP